MYDESKNLVKNIKDNDFNENKINKCRFYHNKQKTNFIRGSLKKHVDDEIDKNTLVRFNQTLGNHLKVSGRNDKYNPTKNDKINWLMIQELYILTAANLFTKTVINMFRQKFYC